MVLYVYHPALQLLLRASLQGRYSSHSRVKTWGGGRTYGVIAMVSPNVNGSRILSQVAVCIRQQT
jgi:hypothetical protein